MNLPRRRIAKSGSWTSTLPKSREIVAPPVVPEDWKLVQQAIDGAPNAQEQLFATYTARLYRTAFGILRNKEDAEDALQDSWCKAFASLRSFEGRSSFFTWLTRIAVNSALMIRRKKNVRPEASLDEILDSQPERLRLSIVHRGPNPEEVCATAEFRGLVEQQARHLPPGLRSAFQLCDLQGHTIADSIRVLGIRRNAFKSRISRARHKLANSLQQCLQPPASKVSAVAPV